MSKFGQTVAQGWRETRGNLAVELLKSLGVWTLLGAAWHAISQTLHRVPVDWLMFFGLIAFGLALVAAALYQGGTRTKPEERPSATAPVPVVPIDPPSLRDRTYVLATDISRFLRELPPRLDLPHGNSFEEIYKAAAQGDNGRVEKVHHGYMHRFRDRVINLSHELAENGIAIEAEHWEIDPPEFQREENMRHLAKALLKATLNLDLKSEGL